MMFPLEMREKAKDDEKMIAVIVMPVKKKMKKSAQTSNERETLKINLNLQSMKCVLLSNVSSAVNKSDCVFFLHTFHYFILFCQIIIDSFHIFLLTPLMCVTFGALQSGRAANLCHRKKNRRCV